MDNEELNPNLDTTTDVKLDTSHQAVDDKINERYNYWEKREGEEELENIEAAKQAEANADKFKLLLFLQQQSHNHIFFRIHIEAPGIYSDDGQ